jgi:VanZ family protein
VAVAAAVLVASVSEPSGGPPAPPILGAPADKPLHGAAYATLAAAVALGLATPRGDGTSTGGTAPRGPTRRRVALLAVALAAAYGVAMEGLQGPLPYRTFDLLDAAANAVGAAVGAGAWTVGATLRERPW